MQERKRLMALYGAGPKDEDEAVEDEEARDGQEAIVVWNENIPAVACFFKAVKRWEWLCPPMSPPIRMGFDWTYVEKRVLRDPPRLVGRKLGRRKRISFLMDRLDIMEEAALSVFMKHEKERQSAEKIKREQSKAKGKIQVARR